ncbi:CPBP family glutamic-type intramembrane protease [Erythrobacter litoralis]|nr:CPBP family glutamic-type intramembrane protease [Erythrobacter litoralis]
MSHSTPITPAETVLPLPAFARELTVFLRRPTLPERATGIGLPAMRGVLRLYAIDFVAMSCLTMLAIAVFLAGFEFPENSLSGMELTPGWIAVVVLGAPLIEETLFRSWLSGRPGHILAAIIIAVGLFVTTQTGLTRSDASVNWLAIGAGTATVAAAIFAIVTLRHRPPLTWFAWAFPAIFWLVTALFAVVHLTNYDEGALYILLPMVVPQLIAGSLFGYARVTYGFVSAVALHALHNGTAILIVLLFGEVLPA